MTAADEQLVAELAEALRDEVFSPSTRQRIVAALLPVVLADRRRAVAEALREAGRDLASVPGNPYPLVVSEFLTDRADDVETGDGR